MTKAARALTMMAENFILMVEGGRFLGVGIKKIVEDGIKK